MDHLIVHCAATSPRMDIGALEIDQWHRQRGFVKIGYHFVIRRNGLVETGRALGEVGAHVAGHNLRSIGICLVGGINTKGQPEANFTAEQYASLRRLLTELSQRFPNAPVSGHRDFDPKKACPSFDVRQWWSEQG